MCPCFDSRLPSNRVSMKYLISSKSSYARSNQKKICIELEFHAKKFYKCDCPIFRESYSGVFKPYCDVLNPYSGVFLQFFCKCDRPIFREPYSGVLSPIVTFYISIAAFWNLISLNPSSMHFFFFLIF